MKNKFENYQSIFLLYFLFLFLFLISIIYFQKNSYKVYHPLQATLMNNNSLEFIIEKESFHNLNKNKTIYIEGKKYRIRIQKILRDIIKREDNSYHQVTVEVKIPKKYRLLDTFTVMLYEKKRSLLTVFESCWKGEQNEKNK